MTATQRDSIVVTRGEWEEYHRFRHALEEIVRVHTEGVGPCDTSCADEMLRVAREALDA